MSFTRADLRFVLTGSRNSDDDLGGGLTVEALIELVFGDGVGIGQINRVLQRKNVNLPDPAGATFDLVNDAMPPDPAPGSMALAKVFIARAAPGNTNFIQLDPTVLNGWDTVFAGDVVLQPGEYAIWISRQGALVDAGNRLLTFTPAAGADQTLENIVVLGSTV